MHEGSLFFTSSPTLLFLVLLIIALFFFFCPCHATCEILVPRPGIEPVPPVLGVWSLNHWIAREVSAAGFFKELNKLVLKFACKTTVVQIVTFILKKQSSSKS